MSNLESNTVTKEAIYVALKILLTKKEFTEISITELTTKAGVSRMAYYRNYASKEAILLDYLDDLFINYCTTLEALTEKDIYEFSLHFFNYFEANYELIEILIKADLTSELLLKFRSYLEKITFELLAITPSERHSIASYEIHFLVGGLWNILLNWIADKRPQSPETMAHLVDNLNLTVLTKHQL